MPTIRQPGFASGELAPGMWGRSDLSIYEQGLRHCQNFLITDTGAASLRPGLETLLVLEGETARITSHTFKDGHVVGRSLLVFTPNRVRVMPVGESFNPAHHGLYAASPYGADDLPKMRFFQLGVYTLITCPGHPIREVFGRVAAGLVFREYETRPIRPSWAHPTRPILARRYLDGGVVRFSTSFDLYDHHTERNEPDLYSFEVSERWLRVYRAGDIATSIGAWDGGSTTPLPVITGNFNRWASALRVWWDLDEESNRVITVSGRHPHDDEAFYQYTLRIDEDSQGRKSLRITSGSASGRTVTNQISAQVRLDAQTSTPTDTEYRFTEVLEVGGVTHEVPVTDNIPNPPNRKNFYQPTADDPQAIICPAKDYDGVREVRIYRGRGNSYGYVGSIVDPRPGSTFFDTGAEPDWQRQPPTPGDPIPEDKPTTIVTHNERLMMAGAPEEPSRIYGSRVDSFQDFFVPENKLVHSDAAFYLDLGGDDFEQITDMVSLQDLLVFTDRAVWAIRGPEGGPLTAIGNNHASRNNFDPQRGEARALAVKGGVIYQARGRFYYLRYDWETRGYITQDLSAHATHLLETSAEGPAIRTAFARNPGPTLWAVRGRRGDLLSYTFANEVGVSGWARHPTDGKVLDVAVVQDDDRDYTLLLVKRGGKIHLERLYPTDYTGAVSFGGALPPYLDAARLFGPGGWGSRLSGSVEVLPHDQIRVKYDRHLAGKEVYAVSEDRQWVLGPSKVGADGTTIFTFRGGSPETLTLWVGLPINSELELLDLPIEKLRLRNVKRVAWEVIGGRGVWTGPDPDNLTAWRQRTMGDGYRAPEAAAALAEVYVRGSWTPRGSAILKQQLPLPVTVIGVTREGDISDG